MTTIIYEFGYLRIEQAGQEIGFRVDDLKPDDRGALVRAAADFVPPRAAPKKRADPGLDELANRMGIPL